jgi:hypothetical protein
MPYMIYPAFLRFYHSEKERKEQEDFNFLIIANCEARSVIDIYVTTTGPTTFTRFGRACPCSFTGVVPCHENIPSVDQDLLQVER